MGFFSQLLRVFCLILLLSQVSCRFDGHFTIKASVDRGGQRAPSPPSPLGRFSDNPRPSPPPPIPPSGRPLRTKS
ncbi:hypothetical protein BVC80_441g168 [Macleaya cordata]|uniref:Uncharacterized protein n=1 Tax=Macleaya cordata TaxID=56857 RepID=A0A200Q4L8_MACCD|nr:hypothetical protein BVC80_441g168 [Macleaya cordata]